MNQFQIEDILYEDQEILVCRKRIGMAVQSAKSGQMDLECALKNYLALQQKGDCYLGIIHRLDQPVEGVLVFAKTSGAARELNRQMVSGQIEKYYLAVVCTDTVLTEGVLEDYLLKDARTNTSRVAAKEEKGGKRALLTYRLLSQEQGTALLEVRLKTGRHHQIRVQMAHAKMPLWGDYKYNSRQKQSLGSGIGLCAYKLRFYHPYDRKEMIFEVEPENQIFQERGVIA